MEKARILIVEDEAIVAMELQNTLENLGYIVMGCVDTGRKAIDAALTDFQRAMTRANLFMEKASGLVDTAEYSVSDLRNSMIEVSRSLESAAGNLSRSMEMLADQPSQMIFSEPVPPRNPADKASAIKEKP